MENIVKFKFIHVLNIPESEFISKFINLYNQCNLKGIKEKDYFIFRYLIIENDFIVETKKYEIDDIIRKIDLFDSTVRIMEGTNENGDIFNYNNDNDTLENLIEIWFKASKISRDYYYWCMYETINRVERFYGVA